MVEDIWIAIVRLLGEIQQVGIVVAVAVWAGENLQRVGFLGWEH